MVKITIRTVNAAFQANNGPDEVARILRKIADEIQSGVTGKQVVLDKNGNASGGYEVSKFIPRQWGRAE